MLSDFIHTKCPSDSKGKKSKAKISNKEAAIVRKLSDEDPLMQQRKSTNNNEPIKEENTEKHDFKTHLKEKFQEFIGHLDHVPAFLKDNEFIHTGYRINFHTPKKVLKSLFMVHNESVNIWSHLGGAILLIILCVVLSFSVTSIDTQNIKQFVQVEVKELFEPIYQRLPNFSAIEDGISEKLSQTKEDLTKFGENTVLNLEATLASISAEIRSAKNNINPQAIGKLLTNLKDRLETFSNSCDAIKNSVSQSLDLKKLEESSDDLKARLSELQGELVHKIDSADLDWIDIYKYINPNYRSALSRKEDYYQMPLSRWPIIVFLLSAVFCLMCSAIFHLFYCLSFRANQILLRLDYAGVSILITGSCFPPLVYGFYCQPFFSQLYLSIIGFISIIVFFVSLGDKIHSQEYRKIKSVMYGGLGVFAGLPILHLVYLSATMSDNTALNFTTSLPYYMAMGISYLGGLTVYATKCPERYSPGKYDICGHSHQIWHVCVLLGIIFTYIGAFDNYYTRMDFPCVSHGF